VKIASTRKVKRNFMNKFQKNKKVEQAKRKEVVDDSRSKQK
jgi:hypothetical protein